MSIREASLGGVQKTFDLNFMSAVATTQEALPHLEATKGNIVYITSVVGKKSSSYFKL